MLTIPYNTKFEFTKKLLQDIFYDAFEQGSYYWAKLYKSQLDNLFLKNGQILVLDTIESDFYDINLMKVELALRRMSEQFPEAFLALITEDWDSNTSDIFLQFVVFGEHKYG